MDYSVEGAGDRKLREEHFQYQPLEDPSDTIRLLYINNTSPAESLECQLAHFSRSSIIQSGSEIQYKAISYEWGRGKAAVNILLNGSMFRVRRNLFEFLRARQEMILMGLSSPWMWIDAISLNQGDKNEKSYQVQRMGEIFNNADEVVAWLGYGSHEIEDALEEIRKDNLGGRRDLKKQMTTLLRVMNYQDAGLERLLVAYCKISQQSYWKRLWIVQELVLARKAILQYGCTQVDWELFGTGLARYCSTKRTDKQPKEVDPAVHIALGGNSLYSPDNSSLGKSVHWKIHQQREVFQIYGHWKMRHTGDMPTLDDLLFSFEDSKCDDWQDKVYGLLGMIQGGGEIFVNYDEGRESLKSRALEHFSEIGRAWLSSRDRADKRKRLNTALERVLGFETASVTNGNRLSLRNLRELALQESQTAN